MSTERKTAEDIEIESRTLVEQIALMTTESETAGGFTSEDAFATLNDLITSAREVTGIDPKHPEIFCVDCQQSVDDCSCAEDAEDAARYEAGDAKFTAEFEES